jgi:hypothetical protein
MSNYAIVMEIEALQTRIYELEKARKEQSKELMRRFLDIDKRLNAVEKSAATMIDRFPPPPLWPGIRPATMPEGINPKNPE